MQHGAIPPENHQEITLAGHFADQVLSHLSKGFLRGHTFEMHDLTTMGPDPSLCFIESFPPKRFFRIGYQSDAIHGNLHDVGATPGTPCSRPAPLWEKE